MSDRAWPEKLGPNDDLFVAVDPERDDVKYLVFASSQKGKTFIRDNGAWNHVMVDEVLEGLRIHDVRPAFIKEYDKLEADEASIPLASVKRYINATTTPLVAAAADTCPPATLDIALNLKNREVAIKSAAYGPMNPELPNTEFWQKKAERWTVSVDDARKSVCGNCAAFNVTSKLRSCIAEGIGSGGSGQKDAWDTIDAGELGYCEAFDFKCAASRTCDAWIVGGPIADKKVQEND